jgi:hypothetical protein
LEKIQAEVWQFYIEQDQAMALKTANSNEDSKKISDTDSELSLLASSHFKGAEGHTMKAIKMDGGEVTHRGSSEVIQVMLLKEIR